MDHEFISALKRKKKIKKPKKHILLFSPLEKTSLISKNLYLNPIQQASRRAETELTNIISFRMAYLYLKVEKQVTQIIPENRIMFLKSNLFKFFCLRIFLSDNERRMSSS